MNYIRVASLYGTQEMLSIPQQLYLSIQQVTQTRKSQH